MNMHSYENIRMTKTHEFERNNHEELMPQARRVGEERDEDTWSSYRL